MNNSWNRIRNLVARLKDLVSLAFANIASAAISGLFLIYLASLLGTEGYGEFSYLIAIANVSSVISFFGAGNTLVVYAAKKVDIQAPIFFISIISSIITSVVLFFIFYNVGVSLFVIGYAIFGLTLNETLGRKLYRNYSKYLITQRILLVAASLFLYYLIGLNGVILGYTLSFFPYVVPLYRVFRKSRLDFGVIKSHFGFMMNNYGVELSKTLTYYVDKIIIFPIFGYASLGNYQLGYQVMTVLILLPSIVFQYVLPRDASGYGNKKLKQATVLVSVAIAAFGIFLAPVVLDALFSRFIYVTELIQIMSLAIVPMSINLMLISKFLGNEKSKIAMIGSWIYLGVQISCILIFSEFYGINGVALALVLAAISESAYLISMNRIIKEKTA